MHIDALTAGWNLVAGVGVGFSLAVLPRYFMARNGVSAARGLDADEQEDAIKLAHHYIWSEGSRLICHTISLTLGVWSVFLPQDNPSEPRPHKLIIFGTAFVFGLVAINCLTVGNSIRAYLAWRRWR